MSYRGWEVMNGHSMSRIWSIKNPSELHSSMCCLRLPGRLKLRHWVWGNLTPTTCCHSQARCVVAALLRLRKKEIFGGGLPEMWSGGDTFRYSFQDSDWRDAVQWKKHLICKVLLLSTNRSQQKGLCLCTLHIHCHLQEAPIKQMTVKFLRTCPKKRFICIVTESFFLKSVKGSLWLKLRTQMTLLLVISGALRAHFAFKELKAVFMWRSQIVPLQLANMFSSLSQRRALD